MARKGKFAAQSEVNRKRWAAMQAWKRLRILQLKKEGHCNDKAKDQATEESVKRWASGDAFDVERLSITGGDDNDASTDDIEEFDPDYRPPEETPAEESSDGGSTESADSKLAVASPVEDSSPDLIRDTLWVYHHLSNTAIKRGDAPSLGAWNLLEWARQYRSRFFEQMLPKAMAAKAKEGDDDEAHKDNHRSVEEIRKILQQYRDTDVSRSTEAGA